MLTVWEVLVPVGCGEPYESCGLYRDRYTAIKAAEEIALREYDSPSELHSNYLPDGAVLFGQPGENGSFIADSSVVPREVF